MIFYRGNTGYLTHFPVAQWSKRAKRRQRSQFACCKTEWEIKNFHGVLERRERGRGSNRTSYDVRPWTIRITSGPLLIDKIAEDALKTTDKTLQKNIYIHDGFYRQEYWIATEINVFVSFILRYTAFMLWTKSQLAPLLQKMSAWKHNGCVL